MTLGLQQQTAKAIAPIVASPTEYGASSAGDAGTGVTPAPVGGFGNAVNRTLQFEGGFNPSDSNGTPSNYGINAAAHRDVDVPNLSKDQAVQIYKKQYWDPLGLDNVDPKLAHVVFDTSVLAGPGKAQELMDASGGDPNKFLALRSQFLNGLAQSNPDKYGQYANAWNSRTNSLRADINAPGGGIQVASADGSVPTKSSGAVASDDSNAPKRAFYTTARDRIVAAMANPNIDEGTRAALKAKLDIINKNLSDLKSEEDKAVSTVSPEEFAQAFPGSAMPKNAIVQKDSAGNYKVVRLDNERVPSVEAQAQQRANVLQQQGIDPNSPQGREYILTGKTDVATQMKATEQKTFDTENSKVLTLQQSIADLQKAKELNTEAYSGSYQPGAAAFIHRNVPWGLGDNIVDPNRVAATTQMENLVIGANASLGKDLFGARVTNYDEQLLQKLRASPNMAPDERAVIIDQMINHRLETLQQSQNKIAEMKAGTRYQRQPQGQGQSQPQGQSQQPAAPSIADGATATGPGGQKIILRGGQWVPLR
jgi:lysozyme family protein